MFQPARTRKQMRTRAFTLVELLVVIAIIVLLLALLAPALDRAVYQAELAVCAGRLKATAMSITTYAFENKRSYPYRDLPPTRQGAGNPEYVYASELARPVNTFDMRPYIRGVVDINRMLQCPLTQQVELDATPEGEWVFSSYAMWWGWFYQPSENVRYPGLFRIGDRFTWNHPNDPNDSDVSSDVLVGDYDLYAGASIYQSSHPDDAGRMDLYTSVHQNWEGAGGGPVAVIPLTVSIWMARDARRGLIDLNHAFADGSVRRTTGIKPYVSGANHDPRMTPVPISWTNRENLKRIQIPH
jgi:prepilin-type N-terminal cleavage/methylation domain-containing protein